MMLTSIVARRSENQPQANPTRDRHAKKMAESD